MVEFPEKSCYTVVREYSGSGSTSSQKSLQNGITGMEYGAVRCQSNHPMIGSGEKGNRCNSCTNSSP